LTEEHKALAFTIDSPGWMLFLRKGGERQKEYMGKLLDPSKQRGEALPDDYLRGYIAALLWSATWPRQEVEQAVQDERDELAMVNDQAKYDLIEKCGYTFGDRLTEEVESGGT
jgi:hypothetical protein